jgi:antirestriction protein ArdC
VARALAQRHARDPLLPVNAVTGREYRGVNIPILWSAAARNAFPRHRWLTFRQAQDAGGNVRRGERGTPIVFAKRMVADPEAAEADDDASAAKARLVLRAYTVFNVAQVDGLPEPVAEHDPGGLAVPVDRKAWAFIHETPARIRGGDEACYYPGADVIVLPPLAAFVPEAAYFATALHELGHWTGHCSRLDRDLYGRFGDFRYAAEELIAELCSAFLCAHLGVAGDLRHAGYIEHWIALLRTDRRAIFTAASKASDAAEHLRAYPRPEVYDPLVAAAAPKPRDHE